MPNDDRIRIVTDEVIRDVWARRGLSLEGLRIEERGLYGPVVAAPDVEPAELVRAWTQQLEAAGFRRIALADLDDAFGVVPSIALEHGGEGLRRGDETIVFYAMRGGLPDPDGRIPTRATPRLFTRELLGAWRARGLEAIGAVESVADDQLVLTTDRADALARARSALLATGARDAGHALVDHDGATLTMFARPGALDVFRVEPDD